MPAVGHLSLGAKVRLTDVVHGTRRPSLGLQPYFSFPSFHPQTWLDTRVGLIGLWTQPVAPWLDNLLYMPLALEAEWLGAGLNFPLGQSLLLIAEKP